MLETGNTNKQSSRLSIRDSLRVWSTQNERKKREEAPTAIAAEDRITLLPNAVFVGRESQAEDGPDNSTRLGGSSYEEDFHASSHLIEPGTLFSFQGTSTSRQYVVFVGNVGVQSLLALENGYWALERTRTMRKFSTNNERVHVPGFLSADEIEHLRQYMPKTNITRPVGDGEATTDLSLTGPISPVLIDDFLEKMRSFRTRVDDYQRDFSQSCEKGYDNVANPYEYRLMTLKNYLSEGFRLDYDNLEDAHRMAIVNEISGQDFTTLLQTAEELSVIIIPKELRTNFKSVIRWARQYQDAAAQAALGKDVATMLNENPLTTFIDKARRLILLSRKSRLPTVNADLGPSTTGIDSPESSPYKVFTEVEFSNTDKMFIDFVWTATYRIPRPMLRGSMKFLSTTSLILRAVGAYPNMLLTPAVGRLFLKEIGSADPWTTALHDLALPLPGGRASKRSDDLHRELLDFEDQFRRLSLEGDNANLDSMAHLRKDWGSLPAFAIDEGDSVFAEDAISIQQSENGKGYWIHIHVAHITAWFHPGSIVERYARNQGASCFTVDASLPMGMIPASLSRFFSLRQGSAVLTVSTLLDDEGSVQDVKICAGRLQNVIKLTKDAVARVVGDDSNGEEQLSILAVGKHPAIQQSLEKSHETELAEENKRALVSINTILQKRRLKREFELPDDVKIPRNSFEISVHTSRLEKVSKSREHDSYHWNGDPAITLVAQHTVRVETGVRRSQDLVTQAMRLAAESIARWFSDRQIPAVFIGTETISDNSLNKIAQKQSHEQVLMPVFTRSSYPRPYWNIHMQSYCNITSPLRRYIDMLAMWQADSYLKAEATGLVEPGSPVKNDNILSFSVADVDNYLNVDAHASDTIEATTRAIRANYAIQALFRAFHFQEAPLPSTWEVLIIEPHKFSAGLTEQPATGFLIPFGIPCSIVQDATGWAKMAKHGQFLPVTIKTVEVSEGKVTCTPNGPPTNEQQIHKPISAYAPTNFERQQKAGAAPPG